MSNSMPPASVFTDFMKISIDLTPLYGRKLTGVEMYAIDLYRALLTSGCQIIPIFHCKNEVDENADAYVIPKRNRLWLENVSLSMAVRKIRPDIVIFPIFPPPIDIYYGCKAKVYQTIHDTVFLRYRDTQNFAAKYYHLPKEKLALKKLDGIITISETVKRQLQQFTHKPIYNLGENIAAEYKEASKIANVEAIRKWGLTPDSYYISVSTIEPRKNFDYLLEVILPVLEKQNRKLVLVGRKGWGNNEKLKQMIVKAGNRLIFTDYVSMEELFSLYRYAYAFALLSKDEGFGRTPFEAVACGCKRIILSDIEIFHETFEDNALFLPLDSVEESRNILINTALPLIDDEMSLPFNILENRIEDFISHLRV